MKIVHVSVNDYMGAGLCAFRINKALQEIGIDSKLLVVDKHSNDKSVISTGKFKFICWKIINKLLSLLPFNFSDEVEVVKMTRKMKTAFSLPISHLDISKHPLIIDADIIHLHWVNGMLNYQTFFKNIHKPIVWTLHDENLFSGIHHYVDNTNILEHLNQQYLRIKIKSISDIANLNIVFLSSFLYKKYSNIPMLSKAGSFIINNSVDCSRFQLINKDTARATLGIDNENIYLVFVAYDISEERKGFKKLIKAVEIINNKKLKILAIGKCNSFKDNPLVHTFGLIKDNNKLSLILSAADYFVMPSSHEAFAQTPIEAMACGLPVIVFPVSGVDEFVNENNGIISKGFTVQDLVCALIKALHNHYDRYLIREEAIHKFSPIIQAEKYYKVYNNALLFNNP